MITAIMFEKYRRIAKVFYKYLLRRTHEAMVLRVASSLSYTTLIAVVPLMAIALAVFSAFPVFENVRNQVQDFFIQYLVPDIEQDVQSYIVQFVGATAKLTALGVAGIVTTAILLLFTIENSFNYIFKVNRKRNIATRITMYWTIITLFPLLLGVAFSIKGYLFTLSYFHPENIVGYKLFMSVIAPNLLTLVFLFLSYIIIPNRKIGGINAFWGACISFVCMYVLRVGFIQFLAVNITYKTLYGTLATIPILLIWMYLWWAVVLFGAVFTATLEEFRNHKRLGKKSR